MFNGFNTTSDLGSFDEQKHVLGPIIKARFSGGWRAEVSYHFGLSDDAVSDTARLHVRYSL